MLRIIAQWFYFSACAVLLGEMNDFYAKYWWFDLALHGYAGVLLMQHVCYFYPPKTVAQLFLAASTVANFLVLWEVFEYGMDTYLSLNMQKDGIKDTMEDILVGKIGCFVVTTYLWLQLRYKEM